MPWLKIDDNFCDHDKIEPLSDGAFRLHVCGMNFCARLLTEGFLKVAQVQRLPCNVTEERIQELVEAGLWHPAPGGYQIHDFLDYNPTKEEAISKHEKRAEAGRKGGKASGSSRRASAEAKP